jgi:hypothetical protein
VQSRAWHGAWLLKGRLDKGPGALLSPSYFNPNHSALTTHAWLPLGTVLFLKHLIHSDPATTLLLQLLRNESCFQKP